MRWHWPHCMLWAAGALSAAAAAASPSSLLPERLGRLLKHACYSSYHRSGTASAVNIADIGCDHGLLSLALCESIPNSHIYAIDQSPGSRHKVKTLVETSAVDAHNVRSRLTVLTGDGLEPLIQQGYRADVLVLAGMGVRSMINILSRSTATAAAEEEDMHRIDLSALDALGVSDIILQPWPEHYLAQHHIYKLLLEGFRFCDQNVDMTTRRGSKRDVFYITTRFTRRPRLGLGDGGEGVDMHGAGSGLEVDDESALRQSPLYLKLSRGLLSPLEREVYKGYLRKQRRTVTSRLKGLSPWEPQTEGLNNDRIRVRVRDEVAFLSILDRMMGEQLSMDAGGV